MTPDISRVAPRLYQGGRVDGRHTYRPFSLLALCADNHQPRMDRFRGRVIRPAFADSAYLSERELTAARAAARRVATELCHGGRVLVTCSAGLNRSGLVTGLALCLATRASGDEIVRLVRAARGEAALGNYAFERLVREAAKDPRRPGR